MLSPAFFSPLSRLVCVERGSQGSQSSGAFGVVDYDVEYQMGAEHSAVVPALLPRGTPRAPSLTHSRATSQYFALVIDGARDLMQGAKSCLHLELPALGRDICAACAKKCDAEGKKMWTTPTRCASRSTVLGRPAVSGDAMKL
jgi:hypothetical protein